MLRKRFIALVMALTMLFTLMAPAFTFAVGEGDPDPDQTTHSETGDQLPGDDAGEGGDDQLSGNDGEGGDDQLPGNANQGGYDADKGIDDADKGEGDANNTRGDEGSEGTFDVIVAEGIQHGTVTADKTEAKAGETVTLTVTPQDGYATAEVQIKNGDDIISIYPEDAAYSFTMPDHPVTVTAIFNPYYYTVETVVQPKGAGTIEVVDTTDNRAACDSTVELTITPAEGFALESLKVVNDTTDQTVQVAENSFTMPASNVTVTAVFATTTVTVTFMKGLDDLEPYCTVIVDKGEVIPADDRPEDPELENSDVTFGGWYINNDPETIIYLNTQTFNEDTTLFAQWNAVPAPSVALLNDGLGYATFAAAAAARTSNDDVITLLANITEAYDLAAGGTLKVMKGDYALADPTVPKGCKLVVTGLADGVTTYTAKVIQPLPEAEIVDITGTEDAHTNIVEYELVENNVQETGKTIAKLDAEYEFVLDRETTQAQKDEYASWCCDFLVSFNADMDANSFGLFGAYAQYGAYAFKFPENVRANEEFKLVSLLGQKILCGNGFDIRFSDIMDIDFFCGVYNLSAKNCGKTMTVKLVMWDPGDPTHVEVRDTKTYYFGDVPMPGAEVEDVTGEHTSITEIAFTSDGFEQTGTVEELDAEYLFTLKLDNDEAIAERQTEYYKDWRCDFLVSFDDNMTANSFGLFGAYGPNEVAFQFPENIAANNEFKLCEWIAQKTGLEHDFTIKFSDIINYVQGQFYCGVYNLDFRNAGKKMTVTLVMWNESDPNTLYPIETVVYTFEGVVPELPEAEIVDITGTEKAHKNIVEYELVENVVQETGKTIAKLDAEYEFVLDRETTQAQKDEYAYWCCDFLVSFDADMEANSFGLFGAYAQYGPYAFKFPENVRANEEFKLVSLLGQKILGGNGFDIRFVDIMDIDFFCGVYNLSAKNCGKTMTVKLVMWDPKNPNDIKVRDTVTYTFPAPELPTATVTELEEPATGVALYDPNDIMNGATGDTADLEAEFSFKANDVTPEQMAYYGDWLCDYEIEFIDAFEAGSFGLYGEIAAFDLARGFVWPTAVQAGDKLMLLGDTLGYTRTYQVVKEEIGTFLCGVINLDATNAGKQIAVRLKMWDPEAAEGTEPAKIAEVVYTFKAIYTIGLSSQDTQGNTIGNAVGGGDYASGKDVSVSVENVSEGYAFLGWYKDSYAEGNLVSTEMPYTFTASENINLIAVWESNAALLYDLRVIGKGFTVGDSPTVQNWNADYLNYGPAGTRVNIEYIGPTEEYPDQFVYWVNEAGNILSTGKAFTYVLMSDSTVRLVTAGTATEDLSVYVVFKNAFNQVLSEGRVGDEFEYEDKIPDQPSRMGYTFQYWAFDGTTTEATYAEVESRMSSTENVVLTIVPFYEQNDGEYTVTVEVLNKATNEKTTAKEYSAAVGEKCVVKLADVYTGDATDFRFWSRDGGETAASFDNSQFTVLSAKDNFTLTLVVNGAEVEPYASIAITQMFTTNLNNIKKIGTTLQYYVPEGATVVAAGFLYGKKEGVTYDEALMNLDGVDLNGDTVIMHAASNANGTNALIYTLNYRLKTNDTENTVLHIRAFVSYEMTAGGETVRETIYSDVFSNSYAELN